MWTLRK